MAALCGNWGFGDRFASACPTYFVAGDPIGLDSSTTDNTGGFSAVNQNGVNLGQPAILVSLDGREKLTELRVVVFGVASATGYLRFDQFDYRLDVWKRADYFSGSAPEFHFDLGDPLDVELVTQSPTRVVPLEPFGTSGSGGNYSATYDFRFSLARLTVGPDPEPFFSEPLPAGEWVFGFQSWHNPLASGTLRVAGSRATEGPLPLFSREGVIERGILGGQDPDNIVLYWGMSLAAMPPPLSGNEGDFNSDGTVDAADYAVWRDGLGGRYSASHFNCWRSTFGTSYPQGYAEAGQHDFQAPFGQGKASPPVVPEPSSIALLVGCGLMLLGIACSGESAS